MKMSKFKMTYRTDKSGNLVMVPSGAQRNPKGQLTIRFDRNGQRIEIDTRDAVTKAFSDKRIAELREQGQLVGTTAKKAKSAKKKAEAAAETAAAAETPAQETAAIAKTEDAAAEAVAAAVVVKEVAEAAEAQAAVATATEQSVAATPATDEEQKAAKKAALAEARRVSKEAKKKAAEAKKALREAEKAAAAAKAAVAEIGGSKAKVEKKATKKAAKKATKKAAKKSTKKSTSGMPSKTRALIKRDAIRLAGGGRAEISVTRDGNARSYSATAVHGKVRATTRLRVSKETRPTGTIMRKTAQQIISRRNPYDMINPSPASRAQMSAAGCVLAREAPDVRCGPFSPRSKESAARRLASGMVNPMGPRTPSMGINPFGPMAPMAPMANPGMMVNPAMVNAAKRRLKA